MPLLRVLDLDSGEWIHTVDLPRANPALAASHDGRYVFVLTGDASDAVRIVDTGIVTEQHGDHVDIDKLPVRPLTVMIGGERPSHVVSHVGMASIFFDGPRGARREGSKAVLLDLASLSTNKPRMRTWTSPGAQHGLAVPLGRDFAAFSMPKKSYVDGDATATSLPNGVAIARAGRAWKTVASFNDTADPTRSCEELHGYASVASVHVFGCNARSADATGDGGLLILRAAARGRWTTRKLLYPDDRRVGHLVARSGGQYLVASYGRASRYDALLRIDPNAKALTARDIFTLPGEQQTCRFALSQDGRRVANLLPDGSLRIYAISPDWKEIARFDAVAPFDCGFGAAGPAPSLSIIGRSAFISDPAQRRIREYDLVSLSQGLDVAFDGIPAALAPGASD